MKNIIIFYFLFAGLSFQSTAQEIEWVKELGSSATSGIAINSKRDIYYTGYFTYSDSFVIENQTLYGDKANVANNFMLRYSADGVLKQAHVMVGIGNAYVTNSAIDNDNNIYNGGMGTAHFFLNGVGKDSPEAGSSFFLLKSDTNMQRQWVFRKYAFTLGYKVSIRQHIADNAGNIYVNFVFTGDSALVDTFKVQGKSIPTLKQVIAKFSPTGKVLWTKLIAESASGNVYNLMAVDSHSNIYGYGDFYTSIKVGGKALSTQNNVGNYFFKLNPKGEFSWIKSYDFSARALIKADKHGNSYILSETGNQAATSFMLDSIEVKRGNDRETFIAKLDSSGTALWVRKIENLTHAFLNNRPDALDIDEDGNIHAAIHSHFNYQDTSSFPKRYIRFGGKDTFVSTAWFDIFLVKYNTDGKYLGYKHVAASYDSNSIHTLKYLSMIAVTRDGKDICASGEYIGKLDFSNGTSIESDSSGLTNRFLIKLKDTTSAPVKIIKKPTEEWQTLKVIPNPASDQLKLQFISKQPGRCLLQVTDLSGRTIHQATFQAISGENNYKLDVRNFAQGNYIITLKHGNMQQRVQFIKNE